MPLCWTWSSYLILYIQEHSGAEELSIQCEEAITNVKFLHEELVVLRNFLTEVGFLQALPIH